MYNISVLLKTRYILDEEVNFNGLKYIWFFILQILGGD